MDQENVIDSDNRIIFGHKKRGNLATGDNKGDLEGLMLSEMSDRERQIPYDLTFFVEYKERKNLNTENRLVVARGSGLR